MPGPFRFLRGALCVLGLVLLVGVLHGPVTAEEEKYEPGVPDAELQAEIDRAIDTGVEWLVGKQSSNGGFGGLNASGNLHYEMGTTALAGLALLAGGRKRGDPAVEKVYLHLVEQGRRHGDTASTSTYDAGVALMFITAYWRGEESEQAGRGKRPRRGVKNPCNLPSKEAQWPGEKDPRKWIKQLTSFLVRKRKMATSTWGYPAHRDDHSNTQYAFLGLRAARDCGMTVPDLVFVTAAETMMSRQEPEGPKVPRIIVSTDPNQSDYVVGYDRARGWSYMQEPFLPCGSMTTSGIAVLAICHDALTNPKRAVKYDSKMERRLTTAVADGFAWLDKNWSVSDNPPLGRTWHFYYLYGLERASIFGGKNLIGKHDWYVEGARVLVDKQEGEGSWSTGTMGGDGTFEPNDAVDTAWAILFLARSTRPMPPIPAPVVTPGD